MKRFILLLIFSLYLPAAYPQWIQLCTGFEPNYTITAYDSMVIAGISSSDNFDMAISYDAGNTWSGNNPLQGVNGITFVYAGNSWIYACTQNGVYRANKDSLNWTLYNQGLPSQVYRVIERDSILMAFSNNTLFRRGLEDSSWSVLSDNVQNGGITDFDFDGNLIVVAGNEGVCESYDMGASWSFWTNLPFTSGIIVIKGDTIIHASPGGVTRKIISTGYLTDVSSGLIKLWTPPPGWDYYGSFEQFHKVGNHIFLCGETGVYKLNDDTWYWEHTGLEYWSYGLADNGATLFCVQGAWGIWGRPLDQLIVSTSENHFPNTSLMVYPNPSSISTSIVFELNEKKEIELSLVNLNGQVVKSIYKGEPEKGEHRVTLNCANLPKGIYIARLQSCNDIINQKLVVR